VSIQGKPTKYEKKEGGFFDLAFGQVNIDPERDKLLIDGHETSYESVGLELTRVEDEAGSTGYHIPEGILLVYDPQDKKPKTSISTISTTDVAPAIMANFGLDVPEYMEQPGPLVLPF